MDPFLTGKKYDKIARWWHAEHKDSEYGIPQIARAIRYAQTGQALDVGCGAGGRIIRKLAAAGFAISGIDVSRAMLEIARSEHPDIDFEHASITDWVTEERYSLIVAWDSIFHLPLHAQEAVVTKLCGFLDSGGILAYTFGDAEGDHEWPWHNDSFYYSSIGIKNNLKVIAAAGCSCVHLELDQYPESHVFVIARRDA